MDDDNSQLQLEVAQEKDRRLYFEKAAAGTAAADAAKKVDKLEERIKEYRIAEVEFQRKIKQLEDELDGKDEEIDNLLNNMGSNDLLERLEGLVTEKEHLEKELGRNPQANLSKV